METSSILEISCTFAILSCKQRLRPSPPLKNDNEMLVSSKNLETKIYPKAEILTVLDDSNVGKSLFFLFKMIARCLFDFCPPSLEISNLNKSVNVIIQLSKRIFSICA